VEYGIDNAFALPRDRRAVVYNSLSSGVLQTSGEKKQIGLYEEYVHGLGTSNRKTASGKDLTVVNFFIVPEK